MYSAGPLHYRNMICVMELGWFLLRKQDENRLQDLRPLARRNTGLSTKTQIK